MKLKDVLEADVVDLSAVRKQKAQSTLTNKLHSVAGRFQQHQEFEQQANDEFVHFSNWAEELKRRHRILGFETLNDVFYFLVVDARLPNWTPRQPSNTIKSGTGGYEAHRGEVQSQQKKIREWYEKLNGKDKKKFLTIVTNSNDIRRSLQTIQSALRMFQNKWRDRSQKERLATPLDVFQSTAYIDTELRNDLEYLDHVDDVAAIIEQ